MSGIYLAFRNTLGNIATNRSQRFDSIEKEDHIVYNAPPNKGVIVNVLDKIIDNLFHFSGIDSIYKEEFFDSIHECMALFRRKSISNSLGNIPERKFVPHKDKIVDFLREVWGPWIAAGELTRPMLRREDPKAYMALANWLRVGVLPDDLQIPTKSEAVDRELPSDPERLKAAARLVHAADARLYRARQRSAKP